MHTEKILQIIIFIIKYPATVVLITFSRCYLFIWIWVVSLPSNSTSFLFISFSIKFDFTLHSNSREQAMIGDVITVIGVSICVCQPPLLKR